MTSRWDVVVTLGCVTKMTSRWDVVVMLGCVTKMTSRWDVVVMLGFCTKMTSRWDVCGNAWLLYIYNVPPGTLWLCLAVLQR